MEAVMDEAAEIVKREPKFMTIEEVAAILDVGRSTVMSAVQRGQFVGVRLGGRQLIHREAFFRWLDAVERHALSRVDAYLERLEEQAEP